MAKMTRERKVKERRALKLEKKQAATAARNAKAAETTLPGDVPEDEDSATEPSSSPAAPERGSQASPSSDAI